MVSRAKYLLFVPGDNGALYRMLYQAHMLQHMSDQSVGLYADIPVHQRSYECSYEVEHEQMCSTFYRDACL